MKLEETAKKKLKIKRLRVKGEVVEFVSIGQLAAMCGRDVKTVRMWINEKFIPESNFRTAAFTESSGKHRDGTRIYTLEAARKIGEIIKRDFAILPNKKRPNTKLPAEIKQEIKVQIRKIMDEEKLKYS
jgi:5-methylthioribose kinase